MKQSEKVKAKIIWTIELIEELERVPENYRKYPELTTGLHEIRIKQGKDIFRISCFFRQRKADCVNDRISEEKAENTKERN